MLVQEILKRDGLEGLAPLAIKTTRHESLPLVMLNYNQIDSPKLSPVVRECRGLVLEEGTWEVVARSFDRFFNLGEAQEITEQFVWEGSSALEKVDGSLFLLYNYQGTWMVSTRGSFAEGAPMEGGPTWQELFLLAVGAEDLQAWADGLNPEMTFVFELCSRYNKVVRDYPWPTAFLLAVRNRRTGEFVPQGEVKEVSWLLGVEHPKEHSFSSQEEVLRFIQGLEEQDPTAEGFVLRDRNGLRMKVKSSTYLSLHRLKDNGNVALPKHVVPIILAGEQDEVLSYFPEMQEVFDEVQGKMDALWESLKETWADGWLIPQDKQKEFALTVKEHPLSGILFSLRKQHGEEETAEHLAQAWREAGERIVRALFPKG